MQWSFGASDDLGSSTSSRRFERLRSYHDHEFQQGYSSSNGHFDSVREYRPQGGRLPYVNGHLDGLIPNHWAASDLSFDGAPRRELLASLPSTDALSSAYPRLLTSLYFF